MPDLDHKTDEVRRISPENSRHDPNQARKLLRPPSPRAVGKLRAGHIPRILQVALLNLQI
jgi:hypothetical protein